MDITLRQLTDLFCEIAPLRYAESFDNCGMQIGDAHKIVHRVLVTLDVTLPVVEYAAAQGYDAILAHHPILLEGVRNLLPQHPQSAVLLALARHDIAVFSGHTNYDHAAKGTSYCLARALQWTAEPVVGDPPAIARFVTLPHAMSIDALAQYVSTQLHSTVRLSKASHSTPITRVCIATGSGASALPQAISGGAQAFLTGELKYHVAQSCVQQGLSVLEAGHYETEMPAMRALAHTLQTRADALQYTVRLDTYAQSTSPYAH